MLTRSDMAGFRYLPQSSSKCCITATGSLHCMTTKGHHCMSAVYCITIAQTTTHEHGGVSNKHYLLQNNKSPIFSMDLLQA